MTNAKWAKEVKKRDNNKCAVCGSTEKLNAHHIKTRAEFPELATNINNGITLCRQCHRIAHKGAFCKGYGVIQNAELFTPQNIKRVEDVIKIFEEKIQVTEEVTRVKEQINKI